MEISASDVLRFVTTERLVGQLADVYTPAALGSIGTGDLCFAHRMEAGRFTELVDKHSSGNLVFTTPELLATLPQDWLEAFCGSNALVSSTSPRADFMMVVRNALDADYALMQPAGLREHPLGRVADDVEIAVSARVEGPVVAGAGVRVGERARIGMRSVLAEGVRIWEHVEVGRDCRFGTNALIGTRVDAYERAQDADDSSNTASRWSDMPQLGGLRIGNDVRVGANCIVNRGTLADTLIEDGCRIGDRVVIGHNSRIGEGSAITAGAVVCGSVNIGRNVWVGPGVVLKNKVRIEDDAFIGIGCVVVDDVPAGETLLPAPNFGAAELIAFRRLLRRSRS